MEIFKLSDITMLNPGKDILTNVEKRKAMIKRESDFKRNQLLLKWKLNEERFKALKNRRKIEQIQNITKNIAKTDKIKIRQSIIKDYEINQKQDLVIRMKNKDQKTAENIEKLKQSTLNRRLEKEVNQFKAKFEIQTRTVETNKSLLAKCVTNIHNPPEEKEEVFEEIEKIEHHDSIEDEAESSKNCEYILQKSKSVDNLTFVQRIELLRINFSKCVEGATFWNKTAPLWDKMTACLQANNDGTSTIRGSEQSVPKEYATEETRRYLFDLTDEGRPTAVVQQIMMNDVDYYLSDQMMIEMVDRAKSISEPGGSAADVMHLTRCMIEYESDVMSNVDYMLTGLAERAIFEFTKKRTAERIYLDLRKTVDRLQHLNDKDLIPKQLIKSQKKDEVTSFVFELISNDEEYGRFDNTVDHDPCYISQISETAKDRMKKFMWENYRQANMSEIIFSMKGRVELFECADDVVRIFLERAHHKTAHFMSTSDLDEYEERINTVKGPGGPNRGPVTLRLVYRISRKISKLVFGMFGTEKLAKHNYEMTIDAYVLLVSNRTKRVRYHTKVYKPLKDVSVADYLKMYNDIKSTNRKPRIV